MTDRKCRTKLVRDAWKGETGATMVVYAVVTGAIAVVCVGAVTYLNWSTEEKIQARADQSAKFSTNKGSDPSLAGEVAKSTAILGGIELPFQFGLPLFAMPTKRKNKEPPKEGDTREATCPGGQCSRGETTCFVAGTLVLTPTGYRKIEDIRVGDEVLSIPEDSPWATAEVDEDEDETDFDRGSAVSVDGSGGTTANAPRADEATRGGEAPASALH